jgi:hypothetical protein
MTPKHPPGPPMTLGQPNACRHQAVIDVSSYPLDTRDAEDPGRCFW